MFNEGKRENKNKEGNTNNNDTNYEDLLVKLKGGFLHELLIKSNQYIIPEKIDLATYSKETIIINPPLSM